MNEWINQYGALVESYWQCKAKYSVEILCHCHFARDKSHVRCFTATVSVTSDCPQALKN